MESGDGPFSETQWLALTLDEARQLRDELDAKLKDLPWSRPQGGISIADPFGRTLLVNIMEPDDPRFRSEFARPS
jgi:hypothetical protein